MNHQELLEDDMSEFNFGNADESQREAISTVDGPVLIIAGPGTGKTYTLVQRALYLIEERGVRPENIFIARFTDKAAMELTIRISNELNNRGICGEDELYNIFRYTYNAVEKY